jgi:hypothetical protein
MAETNANLIWKIADLFAYTGIAHTSDRARTPVGDWLRETLRGITEVFDVSMQHLKARLDRDFGRHRKPLIINALVIQGQQRWIIEPSNLKAEANGTYRVVTSFGYVAREITEPQLFVNGSGAQQVVNSRDLDLLRRQLAVRPKRPQDHMKLLASANRRAAKADPKKRVSPFCHVSFVGENEAPTSTIFTVRGESVPFTLPMIAWGIDLSFPPPMSGIDPSSITSEERNKHLKRRD